MLQHVFLLTPITNLQTGALKFRAGSIHCFELSDLLPPELRESNVITGVCHSFHMGGGGIGIFGPKCLLGHSYLQGGCRYPGVGIPRGVGIPKGRYTVPATYQP